MMIFQETHLRPHDRRNLVLVQPLAGGVTKPIATTVSVQDIPSVIINSENLVLDNGKGLALVLWVDTNVV